MAYESYDGERLDDELFFKTATDPDIETLNLIGESPEACAEQLLARYQPDRLQMLKEDDCVLAFIGFNVQRGLIQRLPLRGPLDDLLELIQQAGEDREVYDDLHTVAIAKASVGVEGAQELLDLLERPLTAQDWAGWFDEPEDFDDMLSTDPASLLPYLKPEVRYRVVQATLFSIAHPVISLLSRPAERTETTALD